MAVLTYPQVYALARSVGCTDAQAVIATAIAQAESGLNPRNVGDSKLAKYGSRGLWQIFTAAHRPAELGIGTGGWNPTLIAKLEDPATNARAMWSISDHGRNFRPWSTYVHLSYVPFLTAARAASKAVGEDWGARLPGTTAPPDESCPGDGAKGEPT